MELRSTCCGVRQGRIPVFRPEAQAPLARWAGRLRPHRPLGKEPGYDVMLQAFSGMISTIGDPDGAYARVNRRAVRCYTSNGYAPISNHGKYAGNPHAVCLYTRRGWQR
jgi:hypothetical protein